MSDLEHERTMAYMSLLRPVLNRASLEESIRVWMGANDEERDALERVALELAKSQPAP